MKINLFPKIPQDKTRYPFFDGYTGTVYALKNREVIIHPDGRYWVIPKEGFHLPICLGRKPAGKISLEEGITLSPTRHLIVTEDENGKISIKRNPKPISLDDINLGC
jgi:hypothetical protein